MASRRFSSFKRRSGSSRFRSRSRTHRVTRPQRWTAANFSLIFDNDVDTPGSGGGVNTVIVLCQIQGNIFRPDNQINLAEQQRYVEIGGIVFDWQMLYSVLPQFNEMTSIVQSEMLSTLVLCTDRLDSLGNPAAIDTNWFNTQSPISLAVGQTIQDEDVVYPTRIHWRHSRAHNLSYVRGDSLEGAATALPQGQAVTLAQGSANLRLRTRLDDEQVLTFHFASILPAVPADQDIVLVTTRLHLNGTLYYRVP